MLLTIFVIELKEGLALGGIVGSDADRGPLANDIVGLGAELFENGYGLVLVLLHAVLVAIFEKEGHPGIDDEKVDKGRGQPFGLAGRRLVELVVVGPIVGSGDVEKALDFACRRGFEQTAEKVARTTDELSELADAQCGEAVGTEAKEFP